MGGCRGSLDSSVLDSCLCGVAANLAFVNDIRTIRDQLVEMASLQEQAAAREIAAFDRMINTMEMSEQADKLFEKLEKVKERLVASLEAKTAK